MMHISEVAEEPHAVRALDVHIGENKQKLLLVLRSSKTHNRGDKLQLIQLGNNFGTVDERTSSFTHMEDYLAVRPKCKSTDEQFFVFKENIAVHNKTSDRC